MKKANILNLIKYHIESNEAGFRAEAYEIAKEFDRTGDSQLAGYIMSLMSTTDTLTPQDMTFSSPFLEAITLDSSSIFLPSDIHNDIIGIINAINHKIGINKFLFQGAPGTGKTEAVKHLARLLNRQLLRVNTTMLVDSKLGQTQKNIAALFSAINQIPNPNSTLILFDELDAIALDRTNDRDLREMGRATTEVLKGFDCLNPNCIVVATTNLFIHLDKALSRRFDFIVDFNRYTKEDLIEIAGKLLDAYLDKIPSAIRESRLFKKIMALSNHLPYPGDLTNIIKTSIAFSDPQDKYDYLRRLLSKILPDTKYSTSALSSQGFTIREIGILLNKSKSTIDRELQSLKDVTR